MKTKYIITVLLVAALGIGGFLFLRSSPEEEREVLYYASAMHPEIRVSVKEYRNGQKTCPICGMDLYPVYAEEEKKAKDVPVEKESGMEEKAEKISLQISPRQAALIGITSRPVRRQDLYRHISAPAEIFYGPELYAAQQEYISALESYEKISAGPHSQSGARAGKLIKSARLRLKLLGLSDSLIEKLERPWISLLFPDDTAWVMAHIYESEVRYIKEGDEVTVKVPGFADEELKGNIASISPAFDGPSRTLKILSEITNPGQRLRPGMFANMEIHSHIGEVLAVAADSILDTGSRKVAWVDSGGYSYEMRNVVIGARGVAEGERFLEIAEGIKEGEKVIARANFLIDSQSQLTGPAAAAYGGAVDVDEAPDEVPAHIH